MITIPRTFCISLKETSKRTNFILQQCKLHNLEVEIFDAINGNKLGLLPENFNKLEFPNDEVKINYGGVGCALSHYLLWNLIKYLPENEFFILEDDCIFCENFKPTFLDLYSRLPSDWEMAYVGWITYGKDITPTSIAPGISKRIPSATHAYLIKKSASEKLIDALHPISSPIDLHLIDKALPRLNYYVLDPSLVSQRSYMNFREMDWLSSGYNWDMDLYGVKRKLLREFKLLAGWYGLERSGEDCWKWTSKDFKISIPDMKTISFYFSSAIDNNIIFYINNEKVFSSEITEGNNHISFKIGNNINDIIIIRGELEKEFIPSKTDANSKDERSLGVCMKKLEIEIGDMMNISIKMSELSR